MTTKGRTSGKIVIIGAGPAGCSTALHLAALRPDLTEHIAILEKAAFPRDKPCGGGLTPLAVALLRSFAPSILDEAAVPISNVLLASGDRIHNKALKRPMAVIHRRDIDHQLSKLVVARGIAIHENSEVRKIERVGNGFVVHTNEKSWDADAIIGADGAQSVVRPLVTSQRGGLARLIEVVTPDRLDQPPELRSAIVFDFSGVSTGLQGYTWRFPCQVDGVECINWGIFDSRIYEEESRPDLPALLQEFMASHNYPSERESWISHPVRRFVPTNTIAHDGILLIGDAAGVDPALGEGISIALDYGDYAATTLIDAISSENLSFAQCGTSFFAHPVGQSLTMRHQMALAMYRPGEADADMAVAAMSQWLENA